MRDPNRIEPILELVDELWHRHPDQRFGQLVYNLLRDQDVFGVEDDVIIERLHDALENWG